MTPVYGPSLLGQRALVLADVRFGDDPDERVGVFDHEYAIQLVLCHQLASGIDIGVGTDGHQVLRGDVLDSHGTGVLTGGDHPGDDVPIRDHGHCLGALHH